jgi:hypothetical protein
VSNYPSVPQVVGSTEDRMDGTVVDRAVSGKPRLRSYYSQTWRAFTIVHDCSQSEKDSIVSFYEANKTASFYMTWQGDGQSYLCRFTGSPQCTPTQGDFRWTVKSMLIAV